MPETMQRIIVSGTILDYYSLNLEYMEGGSLYNFLAAKGTGMLDNQSRLVSIANDIAIGINYLHSLDFYHGGLNCNNVLVHWPFGPN